MLIATARIGITVSTVAAVLSAGIHAGTGALFGIPPQLPNNISIQNVISARYSLCSSRFGPSSLPSSTK